MSAIDQFSDDIMQLISQDKLKEAIEEIKKLLEQSPRMLNDVVMQSARYNEVMASIHRGTINYEDASIEKNKIRFALMNLLQEISEGGTDNEAAKTEVDNYLKEREAGKVNQITIKGDHNINAQDISGSTINIQIGNSPKDKSGDSNDAE